MVWWEAVLSPALQVLFDKLASGDILNILQVWNVNELLLDKLKISYFINTAVLDDAEEKQYLNPAVETWIDMLRDAVFEAEDTLDELATEALRCKLEPDSQKFSQQVRNSWNFIGMKSRIEELITRLEYIAKQKDVLGLESNKKCCYGKMCRGTPSTPLLLGSHVYGRYTEKEELIELLVSDCDDTNRVAPFCVIPLIGMGGIGKTTLAQIVYNDKRICEEFDIKAWAWVSDDFSVTSITKSLLESATAKPFDTNSLEIIQNGLKNLFSKKRFLIVLDDVWSESCDDWNELLIPFFEGDKRSKIIVTTRNEGVASITGMLAPYRLQEMSHDDCWSLFLHHAFGVRGMEMNPRLKEIGEEIVKRCKGLPLAIKTLGGMLSSKLDITYWTEVLNSNLWDLPSKKYSVLPSLRLSYHHLPPNLRRCFGYCSIFPKGYELNKKDLILLWMAEGFVQPMAQITMEEVGNGNFTELQSRCFFQESSQNRSLFVMHDLVHDLALSVSRRTCIQLEENWKCRFYENCEKARYFSCIRSKYDVFRKFEMLSEMKRLRTFLPLASSEGAEFCYLTKKVLSDILPKLSCLRVLSLSYYCITEIPESIGFLKHLRFLNFSYTEIKYLPQSISDLYNLQTLLLRNCYYLIELPADMGKLLNLRYLDVSGSGLQKISLGLDKLVCLRTLPEFVVGSNDSSNRTLPEFTVDANSGGTSDQKSKGSGIGALSNLLHLEGSLSILNLENVDNIWDAHGASLITKKHLRELLLQWSDSFEDSEKARMETDVLELLRPHQNIEKVTIKGYSGTKLPTWTANPSFHKLVSLSLINCKGCRFLPSLGQLPSLKNLMVKGLSEIRSIGDEFFGYTSTILTPFASLETLSFTDMLEWEDWLLGYDGDREAFCNLLELHLEECPKLRGELPDVLPCLVKLVICECQLLDSSLPRLPQLNELELRSCHVRLISSPREVTKLTSLQLSNLSNEYLPECFLASLRHLVIRHCDLLVSLSEEGQNLPRRLEYVELENCHNLQKLPSLLHTLTSLEVVIITNCPRLESFAGKMFPSNLKALAIQGCSVESLPEAMMNSISSLEYLSIHGCLMLASFQRDSELLPTTFQQLKIEKCPNLEFLPAGMMHINNTSLQVLEIFDCSSISSFPGGQLPNTLKTLTVWNCFNLEALPDIRTSTMLLESLRVGNCTSLKHLPHGLNKLLNLSYFEVDGCHGIKCFPREGLPQNLTKVLIIDCENLTFLPKWMQNLTSLQELQLSNCPLITSFTEGGFPTSLVSLDVKDCKNLMPMSEWGLHRLASLRRLTIHGISSNLSYFPQWLLPSTLETLNIVQLSNLESLSPWLQNLTSLENLKVKDCRKLLSLPKEDMPPMLSYLEISECPLSEQKCDLSKIDHIPCTVM
ncbi:hypothetical protein R3W88_007496 [Solanum pinnatisectum]|uniref:Disease resistance RPP13-like protein 1 n=1 Tax=Solanum pinnatisectum TaxID=50273 RepID=A0AAV9M8N8_9SOLN|nr:hypothetical protein R3W88_007496 [Solanum pinnatisectum]